MGGQKPRNDVGSGGSRDILLPEERFVSTVIVWYYNSIVRVFGNSAAHRLSLCVCVCVCVCVCARAPRG